MPGDFEDVLLPEWWAVGSPSPRKPLPSLLQASMDDPGMRIAIEEVQRLVVDCFERASETSATTHDFAIVPPPTRRAPSWPWGQSLRPRHAKVVEAVPKGPDNQLLGFSRDERARLHLCGFDDPSRPYLAIVTLDIQEPQEGWRLIAAVSVAATWHVFRPYYQGWSADQVTGWSLEDLG